MSDAVSVSASELLGGEAPKKKQRPPLPPGYVVKPVYPGASYGIHPVDKQGIKLADAKLLETPLPAGQEPPPQPTPPPTPAPAPQPTPPTPEPQPQQTPQPEPAPQPQPGPQPDFSDLPPSDGPAPGPGGEQQQQSEPTPEQVQTAYARMAEMFFLAFVNLLASIFGDFWLPKNPQEMKIVTGALVDYFNSIAIAAFSPLENLWMAIGMYSVPRLKPTVEKIVDWFKSRKKPRTTSQPEAGKKTNDQEEPIVVDSEILSRGPGI